MAQNFDSIITINAILIHHNGNTEITLTNTRQNLIEAITDVDIILSGVTIDTLFTDITMQETTLEDVTYFKLEQNKTVIHNFAPYHIDKKLYTTHYKITSVRKIDNTLLYKKHNRLLNSEWTTIYTNKNLVYFGYKNIQMQEFYAEETEVTTRKYLIHDYYLDTLEDKDYTTLESVRCYIAMFRDENNCKWQDYNVALKLLSK